jgi:hypothetical protein
MTPREKEIENRIIEIDKKIANIKREISESILNSVMEKCTSCGGVHGLHKTNCLFIKKFR